MGTTAMLDFITGCLLALCQIPSLTVVIAVVIALTSRRRVTLVATECERCRYSLVGLPEYSRCPECGMLYTPRIAVVSEWVWRPWIIPLSVTWLIVPAMAASTGCLLGSWLWVRHVYGLQFGDVLWSQRVQVSAAHGAVAMVPLAAAIGVLLSRWTGWRIGLFLVLVTSGVLAAWTTAGVYSRPGGMFDSFNLAPVVWWRNRVPFPVDLDVMNGVLFAVFVVLCLAQSMRDSSVEPWSPPPRMGQTGDSLPGADPGVIPARSSPRS